MPITPGRRLLLLCVVLLGAGCGAETYRARVNETAAYFAYQDQLRNELGTRRSELGVSVQPPGQFHWIAPPPPPEVDENGEAIAPDAGEDPRQPHYLGITLPGLLGAWEADIQAEVGGQDEPRKAYLYLLGNHSRYLDAPDAAGFREDPHQYLTELEDLLSGTIGVVLPDGDGRGTEKNQRYREVAPRSEPNTRFAPRQDFVAITLSPQIDVGDLDLPFEMQLYEWDGNDVQVALLMVFPQSVSPREDLHDRLLLALETLNIQDVAPSAAATPGGAPSGGGIAF